MDGILESNKCKIGSIELQDNFDIFLKKREYFVLHVNDMPKALVHKFYRLRNHFVNCNIHHEKLTYFGKISIRGVSTRNETELTSEISIKVCFEA